MNNVKRSQVKNKIRLSLGRPEMRLEYKFVGFGSGRLSSLECAEKIAVQTGSISYGHNAM